MEDCSLINVHLCTNRVKNFKKEKTDCLISIKNYFGHIKYFCYLHF